MTADAKKQYKAQKIYSTGVLHADLLPFFKKNPKTRSAGILEENGLLTFYLAGAKHASCVISPEGKTIISYERRWEHDAIVAIVKDAMRQAGYNPENVKLERYLPAYDEVRKPYELFESGFLNYDTNRIFLKLIPELKEQLKKAKTNKFRVKDAPCLLLGAEPVFEKGKNGEIIVHTTSRAREAFSKLQRASVFCKAIREKIDKYIKERFKSAGLPFKEEWMED